MLNITKGKINRAQKVVIYGPEGIGKSSLAARFPDPVINKNYLVAFCKCTLDGIECCLQSCLGILLGETGTSCDCLNKL